MQRTSYAFSKKAAINRKRKKKNLSGKGLAKLQLTKKTKQLNMNMYHNIPILCHDSVFACQYVQLNTRLHFFLGCAVLSSACC